MYKSSSRTKNSVRNVLLSMGGYIISIASNLILRPFFIKTLGSDYLGVNGLFTNILNMLSLAELGVGTAIIYKLYKPVAEDNKEKICELMNFYKNVYRIIGLVVAVIGLSLLPFLNRIIKDPPQIDENLYLIYLLFLTNSVVSYFLVYRRSLIVAYQNEYTVSLVNYGYTVVLFVLQLTFLLLTHNYYAFLIIQIGAMIGQNLVISIICGKKYPFVKNPKPKLPKKERYTIFKDVGALVFYKVSGVVINSTDNIILSAFVSINAVGLYSNYYYVINSIYSIIKQVMNSFSASIGNLNATSDVKKQELVYNSVNFMAFWLYGMVCVCLYVLLSPFIIWWVGDSFVLDINIVTVIVANFYMHGITNTYNIFRTTFGLFVQGQLRPMISALVNLVVSLILVQYMGIIGVLLGTLISYVSIYIWYDPLVVYRHVFNKSVLPFYWRSFTYVLTVIAATLLTSAVCSHITLPSLFMSLIVKATLCIAVSNGMFAVIYSRTKEFKYVLKRVKIVLKR